MTRTISLALLSALFILNIFTGSVHIPAAEIWEILFASPSADTPMSYIIHAIRIPQALTALCTGAALGAAGLLLQSYFRNQLAGPSILGITGGSNLAVAIGVLLLGNISGLQLVGCAFVGSAVVLLMLVGLSLLVRNDISMLIVGILLSYITSAILSLLQFQSAAEGVQTLMVWGMGSFSQVGLSQLPLFVILVATGLLGSALLIKPLNGWMMGEAYARNLGVSTTAVRWGVLLVTGLLCAVTTAWCGPIAFVGLSVPHIARMICRTDNHRQLLPMSMTLGACITLLCLWLSTLPDGGRTLPINALTPLFGVPVILYVLLRRKM
ncbi:MAG: iron ABC transporter permease [Bacteroidales bacterium]|nr:iron ABC transporter permease [Candidatus Liminaster caballi]